MAGFNPATHDLQRFRVVDTRVKPARDDEFYDRPRVRIMNVS